jgi:SNF2 family DNA or RNA helicase
MEFFLIYNIKYNSVNPQVPLTKEQKETVLTFKQLINFKQIILMEQTKKNEQVYEHFMNKQYFPKITKMSDTNIYYSEFILNTVQFQIVFFEFPSSELITPTILREDPTIATTLDRHIKALNNITNQDKEIYDYYIEKVMNEISGPHFYDLTPLHFESMLNNPLYLYQKGNINWMLNIEANGQNNINTRRHIKFLDGRIYEYESNKFIGIGDEESKIKINGGLIYDEVGIGKTLQFICLAISNPNIITLILVPDHLQNHWINQFKIHLKTNLSLESKTDNMNKKKNNDVNRVIEMDVDNFDNIPYWIKLVSFSNYLNYKEKYQRVIVDEIHELYSKMDNFSVFKKVCETKVKYKWGLTATPFPQDYSIFNLIKFLTSQNVSNNYIEKLDSNIRIYKNFMRRNILANIKNEVVLPELEIINNVINFTTKEQIIYDAEHLANVYANTEVLRKLCCDTILAMESEENGGMHFANVNLMFKNHFEKKLEEVKTVLEELKERLDKAEKFYNGFPSIELLNNIQHFKREIESQNKAVESRTRSLNFLVEQFKEQPMCPVCLEDIETNTDCSIINVEGCNHVFCNSCIDYIVENNRVGVISSECKCPNCRKTFNKSNLIKITPTNIIQKYPSKIHKLIEIINLIPGQVIIFTQYDKLIEKISQILNNEQIPTNIFNSTIDIENFRQKHFKVIILSSKNNASGLDLSFVNNIIIFEPIIGTYNYLKDIEKQIIGRIYRINQQNKTTVHRLIVANTIEETIYQDV